ncbi:hypothetical protein BT69DRAFT_1316383 [Atractiella rhizophila]|nr:hypothetical protein BT69DRAFT_1316383 [Atractiella rhizophila]
MSLPVLTPSNEPYLPPLTFPDSIVRRMVLDYLVYEGYVDTAKSFAQEAIAVESEDAIEPAEASTSALPAEYKEDGSDDDEVEAEGEEEEMYHDAEMADDADVERWEDGDDDAGEDQEEQVEHDIGMLSKEEILNMKRRIKISSLISDGYPNRALRMLRSHFPGAISAVTPVPLPLPPLPLQFPNLASPHSQTMVRLHDAQTRAFYHGLYDLAKYNEYLNQPFDYSTTELALIINHFLPPSFPAAREDERDFQLTIQVFEREVFFRNVKARELNFHLKGDGLSPFDKAFINITNPQMLNWFYWTANEEMKNKLKEFVAEKVREEKTRRKEEMETGPIWTSEEMLITYIDKQTEKMLRTGLEGTDTNPQTPTPQLFPNDPLPLLRRTATHLAYLSRVTPDKTLLKKHGPGFIGQGKPPSEEVDDRGRVIRYLWEKGTWLRLRSVFFESPIEEDGESRRRKEKRWYNLELELKIQSFIERIRRISLSSASPTQSPASSLILSNPASATASNAPSPSAVTGVVPSRPSGAPLLQALSHARTLHHETQLLPSPSARAAALKTYQSVWGLLAYSDLSHAPDEVTSWMGEARREDVRKKVWKATAYDGADWSVLEAVARQAVGVWEVVGAGKVPGERVMLDEWLRR